MTRIKLFAAIIVACAVAAPAAFAASKNSAAPAPIKQSEVELLCNQFAEEFRSTNLQPLDSIETSRQNCIALGAKQVDPAQANVTVLIRNFVTEAPEMTVARLRDDKLQMCSWLHKILLPAMFLWRSNLWRDIFSKIMIFS